MKVLIPLAAPHDPYFDAAHYHFPKPLIEVAGRPMIEHVIENLKRLGPEARFVFVLRADDCRRFGLDQIVRLACGGAADIVVLEQPTNGAVCSALMAIDHLDGGEPLVIANGDQVIDADLSGLVRGLLADGADAGVLTFDSLHPRWSYVRLDEQGWVSEAVEKRPISRHAVAGFYVFREGRAFLRHAMASMRARREVGGQFYIAPVLNEVILDGGRVAAAPIEEASYASFYTPQRLEQYEASHRERSRPVQPAPLVVIPMAGRGQRFVDAGYTLPKPFIDVAGRPMIERVMANLAIPGADYLLLGRAEHLAAAEEGLGGLLDRPDVTFQAVDRLTEGAACTVLLGRGRLDGDRPILIANCDQLIDFDCAAFVADARRRRLGGSILCFRDEARDPKWSFAALDGAGRVREVREKVPVSDLATVGLYYFARGRDFVAAALDMLARNDRVNGEFYIGPVYNYAIANGLDVGVLEIAPDAMHGLGTPEDLQAYLARDAAQAVA